MTAGLPWYKCFPRDFNDGMVGLTLEERGAYVTILNVIYARGAPVDDDAGYFRALLCCSARTWVKVRASLLVKRKLFAVAVNGQPCLMNRRAAEEIADSEGKLEKFTEGGRRGGLKTQAARKENNGLTQACLEPASSITDTEGELEPPTPLGAFAEFFEEAFAAYPQTGRASTKRLEALAAWSIACLTAEPRRLVEAARSFAASDYATAERGKRVPSFHRWLKDGKYAVWLPAVHSAAKAFPGPPEIRALVVERKGDAYARSYLDPAVWQDVPERVIVCANGVAADRLWRDFKGEFEAREIGVGKRAAA